MVEDVRTKNKYRIDIYIGGDNDSKKINDSYLDKVRRWANETFPDGYTIFKGEGYYNGDSEDSVLLYAFVNYDVAIEREVKKLKRELKQDAILVMKSVVDCKVI